HERVFKPAGMKDLFNTYSQREKLQVTGYVSNALAPPRVEPMEGTGWYYGDGDQAMPAATLAQWDLSFINKSVLTPASYAEQETSFKLKDGTDTHYGMGIYSFDNHGHHMIEHSGEVGGFVSENIVYPDDGVAIVVLTNETASEAASEIGAAITPLLIAPAAPAAATQPDAFATELQTILTGMQQGKIDRTLFTRDCNFYFDKDALADFQSTLGAMGTITAATRRVARRHGLRHVSRHVLGRSEHHHHNLPHDRRQDRTITGGRQRIRGHGATFHPGVLGSRRNGRFCCGWPGACGSGGAAYPRRDKRTKTGHHYRRSTARRGICLSLLLRHGLFDLVRSARGTRHGLGR